MATDGYQNFRLRGIPDNLQTRKQVRELVRAALKLEEGAGIAVHSLARNPLERCSRIATLTFDKHLPKDLQGPHTEWMFTVPGSDEDEAEKWGPQRLVFDTHFRGFTPLHRTDDSECSTDLIAISGLAGHAFGSFKARGGSFMWLRDDLPIRLRQTRILVYGYDTKVVASSSFQNLNDLGNMFRWSLKRLQLGSSACCQIRPTIFLGHSLGGLVVKEAIMKLKASRKAEDAEFLDSIIAFMFFGVPHQGMAIEHLFPMIGEQPNRSLVQSLGKHSAILQRYEEEFSEALDTREPRPEILSFYETEMSPTAKFNEEKHIWESDETRLAVLVDRSSAINGCTSGCAIARNHSEMVKFTSEMDEMYDIVLASLLPLLDGNIITSKPLSESQKDCLKSLFFNEQNFRQAEIHDADNTCAWLLDDPHYRHWICQPRGLLWIKGKPGAGKSVLMKYASEKLREQSSGSRELVSSFYIHGRGVDLQKKVTGVYRALLHELIPHFDDALSQATLSFEKREARYGSYREGRWEWAEKELENLLLQVLTHASAKQRIVIFIDALDECEKDAPIRLLTCLKRFGENIEQHTSYAKICFSSRHYPIIGQAHVPKIVVEKENREDIRRVMEERLKVIESNEERQLVVDVILSKDDGVFQWAVLVAEKAVKRYLKGFGVRGIEREIKKLPTELDNLYSGLLDEVNGDESEKVQTLKLFRWVLFACRPLSVRELREALATDPHVSYATVSELREHDDYAKPAERFERRVTDMSKGLIQFNTRDPYESIGPDDEGSDRQAEFIHQSVPDYLMEYFLKPAESFEDSSHSSAGYGHFELSRSCLRYLTIDEIHEASKLPRVDISVRYPLVTYALRYFFTHVQQSEAEGINQSDLTRLLDWNDKTKTDMAELWRTFDPQRLYSPIGWPFPGGNLAHMLAALGSISAFKAMLCEDDIPIDSKDFFNDTPLLIALRQGHHDIAQETLDSAKLLYRRGKAMEARELDEKTSPISGKSYFVDVNSENDDLDTPMKLAVSNGAAEIILTLIEAGASLESSEPAASPLLYSVRANNKHLLTELIKNGASLDGAVYYAVTRMACTNADNTELIRILLKAGANTHSSLDLVYYANDEFYDCEIEEVVEIDSGSAFRVAVDMNDVCIIKLLLTDGSTPQEEVEYAWREAVDADNNSLIGLLLDHGLHTPQQVRRVWRKAMDTGNNSLVKLLLNHGLHTPGDISDAWELAVYDSDTSLVETLLDRGLHTPEGISDAWEKAKNRADVSWLELLLAYGSQSPENVRDAFRRAITGENIPMFELILADWPYISEEVHAALKLAVDSDDSSMVELFLVDKARICNLDSETIHDVLRISVTSGDKPMTMAILNNTIEMKRSNPAIRDMFVAAVKSGRVSMAELLLDHRALSGTLQPKNLHGALIAAIRAENTSMVKLFLRQKGMVSALGPREWEYAIRIAIKSGMAIMVGLLSTYPVEAGNLEPETLRKALRAAVESGKAYAATLFLGWGAKVGGLQSQELRSHLVYAVESGDERIVGLLLNKGVDIDATDEKDDILATPAFASVLTLNGPTIESQFSRRTNQSKGMLLSGALLYYSLEKHYYEVFRLLISQGPSLDSEQASPSGRTTNAPHPVLMELLTAKRAQLTGIDVNLRNALQVARWYRDRIGVNNLIRLITKVHYDNSLTWPLEYPTEDSIAEILTSPDVDDYHGILLGIVAKAVMRGNEQLVDFMLKYIGARSDSMTGALDWRPGPNTSEKLTELQFKILDAAMAENDGYVAPIVLAVAFKRVSITKLLLDFGTISGESLVQAGFLVTSLNLSEFFDVLLPKLAQSRFITFRTSPAWPFLPYDPKFADHFSQDWGSLPLISQWCSSFDFPFHNKFSDV